LEKRRLRLPFRAGRRFATGDIWFLLAGITVVGAGHAVGSIVVSNRDTSLRLGLAPDSLRERTGIATRRICADDETVTTLATAAVAAALADASLAQTDLGEETLLLYIENGMTHLTPPGGILLASAAGLPRVKVISLDGVCAEPIHAIEIGALMLGNRRCDRVIVCASVDFNAFVNENDEETAGLFGAGAGAILLERTREGGAGSIDGLSWETDAAYWDLGTITVLGHTRRPQGVNYDFSYYQMKGTSLARVALRTVGRVIDRTLDEAGWDLASVDHFVAHQPNPKMLEMGIRQLGLPLDRISIPGKSLGNMGPASVLIAFSMLRDTGRLVGGTRVLVVSFGLGFSCGAAALTI
jgi:3-oxoacyl-[acyl-carrier-protein] synthase-3